MDGDNDFRFRAAAAIAFGAAPIVMFPAFIAIAAPICCVFYRLGWLSFWQLLAAGAFAGSMSALALYFLSSGQTSLVFTMFLFAACGLLAGSVFWIIGFYKSEL